MKDGHVLLRRSSLGDVVLLGSITSSIQGPVRVVTDKKWMDLVGQMNGVDEVICWPEGEAVLPSFSGPIVDLQGNRHSRRLATQMGGPITRIDKHSFQRRLRLYWDIGALRPSVPELYGAACGVAPTPPPWFPVGSLKREWLVIVPGAAWKPKRYSPEYFIILGQSWDGPIGVLGGPGEEDLCARIAEGIPGAEVIVERGFSRTVEVLSAGKVAVGGDTGLMHLAGAYGVQLVMLFGPTDPQDGFFVYSGKAMERSVSCRPCTLHRQVFCPMGDQVCMDISPSKVMEAVQALS